jgi:hypothetical protein
VDRGMGGGKLLESFHVPELRHRSFSSSERLVGILSPVVEPPTKLLIGSIADDFTSLIGMTETGRLQLTAVGRNASSYASGIPAQPCDLGAS